MTYSTRPLAVTDARRLTEIRAAAELVEPTDEIYDFDDVLEELGEDGVNLPAASVAIDYEVDHQTITVACGLLMISPVTDKWRAYLYGDVDPAHRRRGLGRLITETLTAQAISLRDQQDRSLPIELKMWVPEERLSEAALAIRTGFTPVRYFFRMARELDRPIEAVPALDGILIRPYLDSDSEAVRLACNESFADHWGSVAMDRQRWDNSVTGTRAFLPGLSFVAQTCQAAPQIVGFCLNDEYEAETRAHGFATGWISRLGVTRSGRGNGIASALLLTSLGAFQKAGYRDCALMVDADSPTGAGRIYQRVGFSTIDRNTTYLRELPPVR